MLLLIQHYLFISHSVNLLEVTAFQTVSNDFFFFAFVRLARPSLPCCTRWPSARRRSAWRRSSRMCLIVRLLTLSNRSSLFSTLTPIQGILTCFLILYKKKQTFNVGLFEHYLSESFHILYAYNFSWGLPIRTRFDDLDHVSRPKVYE